jgi:N-acylneuraminate cytidylyltransferase
VIRNLRVLALIPARGGSKGLPGKNVRTVRGRPLLAWTVAAAKASRYIDRLVLSSDDEEIIAAALACECEVPFRRPAELATDVASTIDVVFHALQELPGYDVVLLLQPTSPLRTADDIDAVCERVAHGAPACVSVCPVEESPYWMYRVNDDGFLSPLIDLPPNVSRRQDLPPVYLLNGAVYAARVQWLQEHRSFVTCETVAHIMPRERSIDIDTLDDFEAFCRAVNEESHDKVPASPSDRPGPLP